LIAGRWEPAAEGVYMRRYETMMVLHPELPEAQTRETIERAKRLVEGMGGEVHEMDEWGMRDLAYSIRKVNRGYYVVAEYSAQPAVVNELERTLKLADEVLRYMTVARSSTRRRARTATAPRGGEKGETVEAAPPAAAPVSAGAAGPAASGDNAIEAEARPSGEIPSPASEGSESSISETGGLPGDSEEKAP